MDRLSLDSVFSRFGRSPRALLRTIESSGAPGVSVGGPWLAGGSIVRALLGEEQSSDLDFFFSSEEQHARFCAAVDPRQVAAVKETITWKKFTMRPRWLFFSRPAVQAVKLKFFATPDAVLEDFDLTCCQFLFDGTHIVTSAQALEDLEKRQLRINRAQNPASTLHRAMRLYRRGFFFASGSATSFLLGVQGMPAEALTKAVVSDSDDPAVVDF